tara:strand:- start:4119 stop:5822 length:1704 start_codon:yes stop_codon:yes gene_type:complete
MNQLITFKNRKNLSFLFSFIILLVVGSCTIELDRNNINIFTDMTERLAVEFNHDPGNTGEYHMSESIGSGVAIFDINNDGLMDIYFLNGPGLENNNNIQPTNELYVQNDKNIFENKTNYSGLGSTRFSMGTAVGDINNDGYQDIYCSNLGSDQLFLNNGDGTFSDISKTAGINNSEWGSSVIFLDYNNDKYLDIFITNYLVYDSSQFCTDRAGRQDYCGPKSYEGIPDVLYKNNGDNTFTNISNYSNIGKISGKGLGVVANDFNSDGLPDIYVANDGEANYLWINQGNGTFINNAVPMGAAFNMFGLPEAGMGIAIGDVNGDANMDLFVTHLRGETNTLYIKTEWGFQDMTDQYKLNRDNISFTGFGTGFIDYDNDADLDLIIANGGVTRGHLHQNYSNPIFWDFYAEPNLLYAYDQETHFVTNKLNCGDFCKEINNSKGLAIGDINNDGKVDVVINNAGGPGKIYINTTPSSNNWLLVETFNTDINRRDIGAEITVYTISHKIKKLVAFGSSFLSSNDTRIHFGLGTDSRVENIMVKWSDGLEEDFGEFDVNQYLRLEKLSGSKRE